MQPLRIKASGTPITSANFQGLQEMTDGEINQYLSYVLTNKFATDTIGTGTAELNVDTANALPGTSIGTFVDTIRNDSIGTHPTAGATSSTTYYFKQVETAAAESITNRPIGYDAAIKEMSDAQIDTDILDKAIEDMVLGTDYTVGQYSLSASSPAGGTWTSRYTITDTAQGGNTTIYLWQKTTPTLAANADLSSVKVEGAGGIKSMTVAEIEQMLPNFRNRIVDSGIGTYKLQSSVPGAGTWVQQGDALTDTRQSVTSENYQGTYTGTYSADFSGNYVGYYTGTKTYTESYTGSFSGNYVGYYTGPKTYTGSYTGSFSGNYSGNYVGASAYAGTYSGVYSRTEAYTLFYAGFAGGTNYYTGYYTGFYTGFYVGPKTYTGTYTGFSTQNFIGNYVGTSAYSGTYTGTYTGNFTDNYIGTYAGNTISASKETISTTKLWLRTA